MLQFSSIVLLASTCLGTHLLAQLIVPNEDGAMPSIVPSSGAGLSKQAGLTPSANILLSQSAPLVTTDINSSGSKSHTEVSSPGPWGQLEYFPVFMEAPSYLLDNFPLPNTRPSWSFPLTMKESLPALFAAAGLPDYFSHALTDARNVVIDGEWLHFFPAIAELEGLNSTVRGLIYKELRKYSTNEFHVDPVLILSGDVDSWFAHCKMRPELITKLKSYTYMRGECLAFSDFPAILSYAQSEAEARQIMKVLTRTQTLMVKLKLDEKSDLDALMKYWTTGLNLRRKDVVPMLQSIIDTEGTNLIDVVHLFPPLPRKLLNIYPDPGAARDGILPDCHWTSLNFFNYSEQPYLLDPRLATTAVLERFNAVPPPYKFGDILFFLDIDHGDAFHSCIYIADDIVFTKNGRNPLSPWVLMKIDQVRRIYLHDANGRVQGYRNKKAPVDE